MRGVRSRAAAAPLAMVLAACGGGSEAIAGTWAMAIDPDGLPAGGLRCADQEVPCARQFLHTQPPEPDVASTYRARGHQVGS